MTVLINDNKIKTKFITVNDGLNYGRFDGKELEISNYIIKISNQEFMDNIEDVYNTIRDEIKLDDVMQNETSEFSNTEYCSLPILMQHPKDLKAIIKANLERPLLEKLLVSNNKGNYIINSTEAVEIDDSHIKIFGRVFKSR
tara:strand:- start:9882 stop:10307 length:426 start_codon:yes stop_codon:yes gene_type:complete